MYGIVSIIVSSFILCLVTVFLVYFRLIKVRMDALGLLCECLRTTETLTSQELDLIRHFLPPNLNSQSPSVRQQTVSLMKKVGLLPHFLLKDLSSCCYVFELNTFFSHYKVLML